MPKCNQVMNADVVGVLNIAKKYGAIIPNPSWRDRDNGLMTQPLLLRVDDASEGRSLMKTQRRMKPLETRIPLID